MRDVHFGEHTVDARKRGCTMCAPESLKPASFTGRTYASVNRFTAGYTYLSFWCCLCVQSDGGCTHRTRAHIHSLTVYTHNRTDIRVHRYTQAFYFEVPGGLWVG